MSTEEQREEREEEEDPVKEVWRIRLQRMESMLSVISAINLCLSIHSRLSPKKMLTIIGTPYYHASDIADQLECYCQGTCGGSREKARQLHRRTIDLIQELRGYLEKACNTETHELHKKHQGLREKLAKIADGVTGKPHTTY